MTVDYSIVAQSLLSGLCFNGMISIVSFYHVNCLVSFFFTFVFHKYLIQSQISVVTGCIQLTSLNFDNSYLFESLNTPKEMKIAWLDSSSSKTVSKYYSFAIFCICVILLINWQNSVMVSALLSKMILICDWRE